MQLSGIDAALGFTKLIQAVGIGAVVVAVPVESPGIVLHMSADLLLFYAAVGGLSGSLLPTWAAQYRQKHSQVAKALYSGAITGAVAGPGLFEYFDQQYVAMGGAAVLALILPAAITNWKAFVGGATLIAGVVLPWMRKK